MAGERIKVKISVESTLDCNLLQQKIAKELPSNVSFLLENTVIPTAVMCTDSDDPTSMAKSCIPVTITVFRERDRSAQATAQRIAKGIFNAAEVNKSKAVIKSTVLYQPHGEIIESVKEYWNDLVTCQSPISAKL